MASNKANDFVRKVSGRLYERIIGFAWTLNERERTNKKIRKEVQVICRFLSAVEKLPDPDQLYRFVKHIFQWLVV